MQPHSSPSLLVEAKETEEATVVVEALVGKDLEVVSEALEVATVEDSEVKDVARKVMEARVIEEDTDLDTGDMAAAAVDSEVMEVVDMKANIEMIY